MDTIFLDGSIIAEYFYIGLALLVLASLVAGYIDAVAGGAGLILIPAFLMVGLPPQTALAQEQLESTIGTVAANNNVMKSDSIIWKIVPVGIVSALAGAYIGAKVILLLPPMPSATLFWLFCPSAWQPRCLKAG